nr:hypothetical protein [Tanacetum cinerariifolium]
MNQQREHEVLLAAQREQELREQEQAAKEKEEPPQNSDFRQLIGEVCGTKVYEKQKQKQNMEYTMLELLESSVENLVPIPSESEVTSNNENTLIDSSPKFDYLLEEFSGELSHIDPILSRIEEADFDLEEEIRLVENLLYDNSSPRSPEELNAKIADTIVESFSPSLILVEDSDSQMKEIDLFLDTDDLMPSGIKSNNYDSEGDILFLEEFLSNDSISLPENESSNFDHHDDPSFSRPPPEPPDVEIFFDFEPDMGVLTTKMVKDISEHHVLIPIVLPS